MGSQHQIERPFQNLKLSLMNLFLRAMSKKYKSISSVICHIFMRKNVLFQSFLEQASSSVLLLSPLEHMSEFISNFKTHTAHTEL